jgi:hypothetical protein
VLRVTHHLLAITIRYKPPKRDESRSTSEYYRPNGRLLERLYDHFRKTGKLRQLEAEFAARQRQPNSERSC